MSYQTIMTKFNDIFLRSKKSKWMYALFIIIFTIIGILIHILLSGALFTKYHRMNETELQSQYKNFRDHELPTLRGNFQGIFTGNIRTMAVLLFVPVIIYWLIIMNLSFLRGISYPSPENLKILVYILMMYFGYNSFPNVYPFFNTYPFGIFYTYYIYHGFIEIPTFFICAVWSLDNLDKMTEDMHPESGLSLFQRIKNSFIYCIPPFIFGFSFLAVSAFIETKIVPTLILQSYLPYIQ